ncbi:hypothetical protein CHLNCDRAFT_144084 [Chlorella variabilis]|uniref:Sulfotransferase n=1 Tax=Chlorella variabilis TaxID=554065 RepID=E1ZBV1_CHLVA|nr:hypothetical protein CHLNCDRAFT_144084 [Chlorella variabilis]EFN56706.1 hypothetical protein CHLNCDRAFT_144084 [Chlorella variabilis]|eukprot:XP_005848808.1 hypothetical protein CHLNCDRAFT_144084 [Chlorella variabilis]
MVAMSSPRSWESTQLLMGTTLLCTAVILWSQHRGGATAYSSQVLRQEPAVSQPPGAGSAAAAGANASAAGGPRKPQPVVMLMIGRTGSSLLTDVLNRHPKILFVGEKFNHENAWQLGKGVDYFFSRGGYKKVYEEWLGNQPHKGKVPEKDYSALEWVGFKVNTHMAKFPPTFAANAHWKVLAALDPPPKLICLHRRNDVKAVISEHRALALAAKCKTFSHVPGYNCTIPTNWTMAVPAFRASLKARLETTQGHLEICRYGAARYPTLFSAYEDVLERGVGQMADRVLEFVGVSAEARARLVRDFGSGEEEVSFEKTTPDDLHDSLENIEQLVAAARQMYADTAEDLFESEFKAVIAL